jgi:hypothetical protein
MGNAVELAPQIVGSVRASETPTPVIRLDPVSVGLRRRDHPSSAATALLVWGTSAHICGRWRSPRPPPAHPTRPSSPPPNPFLQHCSPHRSGRTRTHVGVGSACSRSHVGKASWRMDSFVLDVRPFDRDAVGDGGTRRALRAVIPSAPAPPLPPRGVPGRARGIHVDIARLPWPRWDRLRASRGVARLGPPRFGPDPRRCPWR